MGNIVKFSEHFFWAMVWVFLLIIAGFALLHWIQSVNSGGVFGNAAGWVTNAAGA